MLCSTSSTAGSRSAHVKVTATPRAPLRVVQAHSVWKTAVSFETARLTRLIVTRQAIKTTLNYLSETNGELHFFLHNYVADNPLSLDGRVDPDDWLAQLASSPLLRVSDPSRSSVPSAAALAAVTAGEREVSLRDAVERIMGLREHIAAEMREELSQSGVRAANADVMRRALTKSTGEVKMPEV
ncbi:hypothetical protein FOA52_015940 [Chlamydomonas sp. UWO 241]|nr:hypothetical protein FOA52_015940 [Chlamydomonas sp. UWO 241]